MRKQSQRSLFEHKFLTENCSRRVQHGFFCARLTLWIGFTRAFAYRLIEAVATIPAKRQRRFSPPPRSPVTQMAAADADAAAAAADAVAESRALAPSSVDTIGCLFNSTGIVACTWLRVLPSLARARRSARAQKLNLH